MSLLIFYQSTKQSSKKSIKKLLSGNPALKTFTTSSKCVGRKIFATLREKWQKVFSSYSTVLCPIRGKEYGVFTVEIWRISSMPIRQHEVISVTSKNQR
ncbi:hypothetical protein CDAR_487611 [Caerostris darwini]|uniref:Ribosomal protein S10 n=1 Tax=Caerostris darwini TaxID=1538125 RepID=A0AAV4PRJ8_9ARAC|nr:hypothetical protein CDAR_487611 [Caerostris darwini]